MPVSWVASGSPADPVKDQSYFLAMLDVEQLEAACFPLASWHKRDVKAAASDLGLVDRVRSESQDLCFVPGGDYTDLLVRRHPELDVPGALVSVDGREVGVHRGYFRYTIGQRRGLGLSGGPWYVVGLCPEANRVIVGRYADLMSTRVRVESLNWLVTPPAPGEPLPVLVQVRYRMRPREAVLVRESGGGAELCLKEPVAAVTPGQAAVFYHGDRVLGGGWIQSRADTVPGHRPKGV
jgi:tRNA-specific 2-thiouridylase